MEKTTATICEMFKIQNPQDGNIPEWAKKLCESYATLKSSQDNKAISDMCDKLAEQPDEIEVGNLVIDKLKHDEYWSNPRNRKTRIVVEIMLREMYLTGWNNKGEKIQTEYNKLKGGKDGQ